MGFLLSFLKILAIIYAEIELNYDFMIHQFLYSRVTSGYIDRPSSIWGGGGGNLRAGS
jgi:hypothetical protein